MKYRVGMSDKRTRSKSVNNRKKAGSLGRISTKAFTASGVSQRRGKERKGLRKYSKLRVVGRGVPSSKGRTNTTSPISRFTGAKSKFKKIAGRSIAALVTVGFILTVVSMIALGLYLKNLESSLPDPNKLVDRSSDQSTILMDRNGKELFKIYGDENRQFVKIEDIPDVTKWALLAAEDVEFYQHKGMDWKGIFRCGILSVQSYLSDGSSGGLCGASTITQQLVRNTIMYDVYGDEAFERSSFFTAARRKLRELLLSMQVEQTLTKDEILQLYMNEVALGGVNYGFEAAAQSYFGKSVKELDLAESSMLAGIIQQPSILSPLFGINPEGAPARQKYVLDQMLKYKDLTGVTEEEISAAKEEELKYSSGAIDIEAYHFVFYIKQILEEEFGQEVVERGGLRVTTTLDLSTQRIAQEEITNGIQKYGNNLGVYNGSMVVLDPNTGQILAMVGSVDPNITDDPRIDGNVNIATSLRQMGSSFKPYVYLTAFQQYGPWFEAPDIPMNFGNYKPVNWDGKYYGLMTAREALIKSRNIPANYTLQMIGIDSVLQTAEKVGITTLTDRANYGLSLALGAAEMKLLEHAQGFSVFATGGIKRNATGILKVENSKGEVLEEYKQTEGERVFDEKDVYLLNWVLCDLGGFGDQPFAYQYNLNGRRAICGKTGTTNGPKDLVSIQYHKNLVVAIWAGNNNGEEVPGAWSTTVPLPIAHSFMERVSGKYPSELPTRPAGILAATVCNETGRLADKDTNCKKVPTIYVQGRGPKKDDREELLICKSNNLVATNTEEAKKFTETDGKYTLLDTKWLLNFTMENASQQNSYKNYVEKDSNLLLERPGDGVCPLPLGPGNAPIIEFVSPADGTSVNTGGSIDVSATARAEGEIDYVEFRFGGTLVGGRINSAPFEASFVVPDVPSGNVSLTAKVVDDKGRTSTATITIKVTNTTPVKSIQFLTPADGATFTLPVKQELSVQVSGFDPGNIQFTISGPGAYNWSSAGINAGSGVWSVKWEEGILIPGEYFITASSSGVNKQIKVKVN